MPAKAGGWPVAFRGEANLRGGEFALDVLPADNPNFPLAMRLRMRDTLKKPRWAGAVTLNELPAATVLEVFRHMGAVLPQKLSADGKLSGVLGYQHEYGLQGMVSLEDANVHSEGTGPVRFERAHLVVGSDQIKLQRAGVELEGGQALQVEGSCSPVTQSLHAKLTSRGFPMVRGQATAIPLLEQFDSLTWKGSLSYTREAQGIGEWSGDLLVQEARLSVPGVAGPVLIQSASAKIEGDRVVVDKIRASAGDVAFSGSYRYEPSLTRPHRLKLVAEEADAAELERLMKPTLSRREGFLARAPSVDGGVT